MQDSARHTSKKLGSEIQVEDLTKSFGSFQALGGVSFTIAAGEFVSILGPSGSGKTTVLMSIAGFSEPTSGRILVAGEDIVPKPAHKRNIGIVFQKYSLFPHMTVARNVAFPLRMRGWSRSRQKEAVEEALGRVQLKHLADRYPSQLSGGQQQRVALARAIVFDPPLLLMDEPLGALDKKLREELQVEIKLLQQRLGITVLFVTHDQQEALAMSDRIAVMNEGLIEQIGTPAELYSRPKSEFVAGFVGSSNTFIGKVLSGDSGDGKILVDVGFSRLLATSAAEGKEALSEGAHCNVLIRPEYLRMGSADTENTFSARVISVMFAGAQTNLTVDASGQRMTLQVSGPEREKFLNIEGKEIVVSCDPSQCLVFASSQGERALP